MQTSKEQLIFFSSEFEYRDFSKIIFSTVCRKIKIFCYNFSTANIIDPILIIGSKTLLKIAKIAFSYIFLLISLKDIFRINRWTRIQKVISQCDVKHIMTLPIKTTTSALNTLSLVS